MNTGAGRARRDDAAPRRAVWVACGVACAIMLAVPFLSVTWPPCTDLPQHVAQMRLVGDALGARSDVLALNWLWPNTLVYAVIGAGWFVLPPEHVGAFTVIVLGWLWIAAVFYVAWRRERPLPGAILATAAFFNHTLYWGFLNFLSGWPVFLLWLLAVEAPPAERGGRRDLIRLAGLGVLLYLAHALWLLAGLGWLAAREISSRAGLLVAVLRFAALLPILVAALVWYSRMSELRETAGFDVKAYWVTSPLYRLQPGALRDATLGGLYGPVETVGAAGLALWLAAALAALGIRDRRRVDPMLLNVALVLLAVVLLAPDRYMSTILLWSRWMPCAVVALLLALPAPRLPQRVLTGLALAAVVAFTTGTAERWRAFERDELSGLGAAIGEVTETSRVLGLDLIGDSEIIKDRPFMQLFAYAQVLRSASLNFSFAEHASAIVRYRVLPAFQWTRGLEWQGRKVKDADLGHFDFVLANATDAVHAQLRARVELEPVTAGGRWRLYRVGSPTHPGQRS